MKCQSGNNIPTFYIKIKRSFGEYIQIKTEYNVELCKKMTKAIAFVIFVPDISKRIIITINISP